MGLLDYPKKLYYDYGSRLAIFLVNRRLRKKGLDPGAWLVLARLYEVRQDWPRALQTLDRALKIYPGNAALEAHRTRIRNLAQESAQTPD
ncbi:Tetratricopeptide repeat-containing protein [Desulfacinum hydrothermale DSM 13146]|uniref:Tetratricopeptide repeat-containing protein n=2 Tax=Desulfacinum hydrothermale TaxID=109258 RepID=A0A1W1XM37_9BACT|nr:Tetratricopeptide repeat-containing protein [Desulfacinum hydrothermale DSM 13146]